MAVRRSRANPPINPNPAMARAGIPQQPQQQPPQLPPQLQPQSTQISNGVAPAAPVAMTLPQIIEIYGKRLNALEQKVGDNGLSVPYAGGTPAPTPAGPTIQQIMDVIDQRIRALPVPQPQQPPASAFNDELISEYNHRFDLLAQEVGDIKNTVLQLQTFTMDVNRKLLERMGVLNDLSTFNVPALEASMLDSVDEGEEGDEEDAGEPTEEENITIRFASGQP